MELDLLKFSIISLIAASILTLPQKLFGALRKDSDIRSYVVFYGAEAPQELLHKFDLLIFDPHAFPDFGALQNDNKKVLAYLSLGEINQSRDYFSRARDMGMLLESNIYWPDSNFVDIRKAQWTKMVIEELIPEILHKKFDGLFIDTLDSPIELERRDPVKYKGMKQAAVRLIKTIRHNYPQLKLMVNRAYAIIPQIAPSINYLLAESLLYTYDFNSKKYVKVNAQNRAVQLKMLREYARKYPRMLIMTLDYCDKNDAETRKEIYRQERENKFIPYVSTIELNQIIPE